MHRIDPVVANNMPRQRLQAEVTLLVSAIATEEKVQLNEVEEGLLGDQHFVAGPLSGEFGG